MRAPRIVVATVVASVAAWVLSTHIFTAVNLLRVKVVQSPIAAINGRVRTTTSTFPQVNDLVPPFALIAHVRNSSAEVSTFSFAIDETVVCGHRIPAASLRRVDCVVTNEWSKAHDHFLTIEGRAASGGASKWALEYLELATHHGSASGTHFLVVLPGSSDRYSRPSLSWVAITSALIFILVTFSVGGAWSFWSRLAYRILGGALTVLLIVIQCSQWLTPFRVVLSADTFSIWLAMLLVPPVWLAVRRGLQQIETAADQSKRERRAKMVVAARAGLVAFLVFAVYGVVVLTRVRDSYQGNYSGMLLVSRQLFDGNPLLTARDDVRKTLVFARGGGYDGQFMYFAAFDPFMRAFKDHPAMYRRVMDAAPYRFGRIGFAWLTWVFSGGRWERYPATMVWLVVCSLGLAAFLLSLMAQEHGLSPALGGLVVAVPGFWLSLMTGLPEPIAAATLLGGLFSLSRGRSWLAGGLFALSLLIRETGLVIVGGTVAAAVVAGRRRDALIVGLLSTGAVLTWRLYVAWILFPDWRLQGLLFTAPNFGWPLVGIRDLWLVLAHGQYFPNMPGMSRAAVALPILLMGGFVVALMLTMTRHDATSAAALMYALIAICLNYAAVWLFVGNAQRVTYELFLALALSSLAIREYSGPLRGGLIAFWSCSIVYVFFLTFDASYIRSALAIPF